MLDEMDPRRHLRVDEAVIAKRETTNRPDTARPPHFGAKWIENYPYIVFLKVHHQNLMMMMIMMTDQLYEYEKRLCSFLSIIQS
mmetsp:Transcript_10460/g.13094  ORF Transcript_10460/g.13094 Transcript_10460/m.13094 type:complete len:84 (-) Transcript_10460:1147-1398(-)